MDDEQISAPVESNMGNEHGLTTEAESRLGGLNITAAILNGMGVGLLLGLLLGLAVSPVVSGIIGTLSSLQIGRAHV